MKLEPWEEEDTLPETPSARTVRLIMKTAGGETIDRVIEAYRIRSRWLKEHPGDPYVLRVGSALVRLYENRGGDVHELAKLIDDY